MALPDQDRRLDMKYNRETGEVQVKEPRKWLTLIRLGGGPGAPGTPPGVISTAVVVLVASGIRDSGQASITGLVGLTVGKPVQVWENAAVEGSGVEFDCITASGYVDTTTSIKIHWVAKAPLTGSRSFCYVVGV